MIIPFFLFSERAVHVEYLEISKIKMSTNKNNNNDDDESNIANTKSLNFKSIGNNNNEKNTSQTKEHMKEIMKMLRSKLNSKYKDGKGGTVECKTNEELGYFSVPVGGYINIDLRNNPDFYNYVCDEQRRNKKVYVKWQLSAFDKIKGELIDNDPKTQNAHHQIRK